MWAVPFASRTAVVVELLASLTLTGSSASAAEKRKRKKTTKGRTSFFF
jgi:hypothetical protein